MNNKMLSHFFLTTFFTVGYSFSMGTSSYEFQKVLVSQTNQADQDADQDLLSKKVKKTPPSLYAQSLIAFIKNNISSPDALLPHPTFLEEDLFPIK